MLGNTSEECSVHQSVYLKQKPMKTFQLQLVDLVHLNREKVINLIAINEAHKIFERMPSFCPSFDRPRKLKELECRQLAGDF